MAKRKQTTTNKPQGGAIGAEIASEGGQVPARAAADAYVRRRAEVDQKDHVEFQDYLAAKKVSEELKARSAIVTTPTKRRGFSRRTMFNAAVGTAVVAEAAVLGYNALNGNGSTSGSGVRRAGAINTEAQSHRIVREVVDSRAHVK